MTDPRPIFEAHGLVKAYGRVIALNHAEFELMPGEVLAVIGDNGAGKSTLVKALSGNLAVDEGMIKFEGQAIQLTTPMQASALGIETVHQDLALAPHLDPVQNMYLGREETRGILRSLDELQMEKRAKETLASLSVTTIRSVRQVVASLSGGQRQSVAVAKAVMWNSKVVILDEPTAALGVAQTRQVLDLVRRLADQGLGVVLISHNMNDVMEVADRVTALYLGRIAAEVKAKESSVAQIVELITSGRSGDVGLVPAVANEGI
jgi:D-xylose transport system ATP-binding protein